MGRWLKRFFLVLGVACAFPAAAAAIEFACFRGRTPAIAGAPRSIASLERVRFHGAEQWILLRGRDGSSPLLLFLHGGPGVLS